MDGIGIGRQNVGRIAERIVANELEYRGFRVSDLNKEGTSANADLLAAKEGLTCQVQVKGATYDGGWWFNYGYCSEDIVERKQPIFNSHSSFYLAELVVLVCVKSPSEYCCIVMEAGIAEEAAQVVIDYAFRTNKKDGSKKKPGKVWGSLNYIPKTTAQKQSAMKVEQAMLQKYKDAWSVADDLLHAKKLLNLSAKN